MTQANTVTPPPNVDPFCGVDLDELWEAEARKPFTISRFRRALVGMARIFFSTAENYFEENQEALACTVYVPDKPDDSGLLVGAAYADIPGTTDMGTPRIMVRLGSITYTKLALGDHDGISPNLSNAQLTKSVSGEVKIGRAHV